MINSGVNRGMDMGQQVSFYLSEGIKDSIFKYRFKDFLKEIQKPYSGNIFERVEQAITLEPSLEQRLEDFIIDEVSNGKNRQTFWCDFSVESLRILGDVDKIKSRLREKGYPSENFCNLLKEEQMSGEMVYLNILENEDGSSMPSKISISFMNKYDTELETEDGVSSQTTFNYVWIDIFPEQQYLLIKHRPYTNQYFANFHHSNRIFDLYHNLLKDIFGITYLNMEESKHVLYNMFKVLTDRAEASYRMAVNAVEDEVIIKSQELAQLVNITDLSSPVDITNRISRLLERALILSDIDNYMAYDPDKLGIVERIDFSDQSGAKVNALSQEEGIEIADIYFDTRETLDELKQLNKLWVRWFFRKPEEIPNETEQIETKLEVYNDRVIIIFLGVKNAPKEVQEYVLSLFKQFKEGEIS